MGSAADVENLFYQGRFLELVQRHGHLKTHPLLHFVIGSFAILGQVDEATLLFKDRRLTTRQKVFCRFWLGVAAARSSQLEKARTYFGQNLGLRHERLSKEERFYLYQGLGFYRYIVGRFDLAKFYGERAWALGFVGGKIFLQILALDLRGQSLLQLEESEQGLSLLKKAKRLAERLKDVGLSNAIEITIFKLKAQNHLISVEELIAFSKKVEENDSYSKNMLALEICEQLISLGRASEAAAFLTQYRESVFASGAPRYQALWYLQETYLHRIAQNQERFQKSLQRGLKLLNPKNNPHLWNRFSILQNEPSHFSPGLTRFARSLESSEFQDMESKLQILQRRALSCFLPLFIGKTMGILVDILPRSVLIYSRGDFSFHQEVLSPTLKGLLLLLSQGPQTREDLISKLYGYTYEAERHDPMIYSLIHRLRNALEPHGEWLEFTSSGQYRLHPQVHLRFFEQMIVPPKAPEPVGLLDLQDGKKTQGLHLRQHWILHRVNATGSVTPADVIQQHQVTHMTAYRDLRHLVELRLLKPMGRGRASYYVGCES